MGSKGENEHSGSAGQPDYGLNITGSLKKSDAEA
jgi:hypothetical protein